MKKIYLALLLMIQGIIPAVSQSFLTPSGGTIPDNNTEVCFPFTVTGLPTQINSTFGITGMCLDITHTYTADLKIRLKSPDNTVVTLVSNAGGSGDNFTSTCLAEDGVDGWIVSASAPFTGAFIPDQSFNIFNNGLDPNGTWELCITDEVPSDIGYLNFAVIHFGNNPPPDPGLPPGVCSTTNASGCVCPDTSITNCDLLPDMTASALIIQNEHTEYPGYLTLSNATPNIGYGPLEIRGVNICYCDTQIVGCSTPLCPDGSYPKQLIEQRIYHKDGQTMSTWDHPAGTMTYHPTHGHMHVDDWATYTLKVGTTNPDPLAWPVVGDGAKISFCLINLGSCSGSPGYCLDTLGNILTGNDIPNTGLGAVSGCGNEQGIFVGSLDIYGQGLSGQQIDFPGICNGDYFIVSHTDPDNNFIETNDNNNYAVVPVTLTLQGTPPANAGFTYTTNGLTVDFSSLVSGVTSYQWQFGDGDSSNVNVVAHTYSAPGTYTVTLELFNGVCTAYVAKEVTVTTTTGVEPLPIVTNLSLIPNPFFTSTTLKYKLAVSGKVTVEVYDLLGNLVKTVADGKQDAGAHSFELQDIAAGVYVVKIATPVQSLSQRIVKLD